MYTRGSKIIKVIPEQQTQNKDKIKSINPSALLVLNSITLINIKKKVSLGFTKIKTYTRSSARKTQTFTVILHSLFTRKIKSYTKATFALIQSQRLNSYMTQIQNQQIMNQTIKQKSTKIFCSIFNKILFKSTKKTFTELKQKGLTNKLLNCYRTQSCCTAIKNIINKKVLLGIQGLKSQSMRQQKKTRGLKKIKSQKQQQQVVNQPVSGKSSINESGFGRPSLGSKQKNQPKIQPQSQPQINNLLLQKYQKLQLQLQSLQSQNKTILQQYKTQIKQLQKKNQSLKFNYQCLQVNNLQMQRQIIQIKQKSRKRLTMNQIWQQIYKNFIYFISKNQNLSITKKEILNQLQKPLVNYNFNSQIIEQENIILKQLIEQYEKIGMTAPPQNLSQSITQGIITMKDLPFQYIVKSNRYYYDIVEILAERGLGRIQDVDSLKQALEDLVQIK